MNFRAAALVMLCLLVVAACANSNESEDSFGSGTGPSYVAIGDSFASGPGIDPQVNTACLRSSNNYPHILAKELEVSSFADVTCAGATTDEALEGKEITSDVTIPAQVDAVSLDTELVTISLGGNDDRVFGTLFGSCHLIGGVKPTGLCSNYVNGSMKDVLSSLRSNLVRVIDVVRQKAPQARIIVLGYLRMLPNTHGCKALPVEPGTTLSGMAALDDALRGAAADAHVEFVSMRQRAAGHDACAGEEAWVNGVKGKSGDGLYMHPKKAGMEAVAHELAQMIGPD